ncbi:MAG: hypothetical protein A4E42_01107 [Methanoregulaceae archaeon PtaU1.Bin222]|nr:MAG: hypothetical protein A4E42_01107 [Methanoregulaceae archaeon PtaU1.Bin222]
MFNALGLCLYAHFTNSFLYAFHNSNARALFSDQN